MSIHLTTLCLAQKGLSSNEKHILTVLCFIADKNNEVYLTIEQMMESTGRSKNTIESLLKSLREKNILIYTGKKTGYRKRIPVYSIVLNHPKNEGDKPLITPNSEINDPSKGALMTPKTGIPIDNIKLQYKDNRKDSLLSLLKPRYQDFATRLMADKELGLVSKDEPLLSFEDWLTLVD